MAHDDPGAYLPIDRLLAIARGAPMPETSEGAALFADVAGFTPLTEALVRTLGPRLGAEEISRQLNLVYDALVAEAHRFGGSVITFSGDAVTCWFEGDTGRRATAAALEMHAALARVGTILLPRGGRINLALKVAVASGAARRFVVGDPALQLIDVLAGATLERMARAERLAHRAEVVLSPECAAALADDALVLEWRKADAGYVPVVGGLLAEIPTAPLPLPQSVAVPVERLRPWLIPALYEQIAGVGTLQPEIRPVAVVFVRFGAVDYDGDRDAGARLDAYIRWVQGVLARYGGALLQLTIGDKGSYFYAIFGAPLAHEQGAARACLAALELRSPPAELAAVGAVQIGISEGTCWAGAYGGAARRTYGVLGDDVNLAARLMLRAAPGEILVADRVRRSAAAAVQCQLLDPLIIKGKSRPVAAARLLGAWPSAESAATPAGPLVGRAVELAWLRERCAPIHAGRFAGVAAVYGEPGIGKSRLAEALRDELGASVTWLACAADQLVRPALHPLRRLLRRVLDQWHEDTLDANRARFEAALDMLLAALAARGGHALHTRLARARPALAALVDLAPTGPTREAADSAQDASAAISALICAECARRPVVLHLEDAAWLDDDSQDVLRATIRDAATLPMAVLVTSRYADDGARPALPVDQDTPQAHLDLGGLDAAVIGDLAAAAIGESVPPQLAAFLASKTGGNPLFAEQLALDLRERGALDTGAEGVPAGIGWETAQADEVPASIAAVLIARLDRLPPGVRAAAQVAAVLGQEFDLPVLAQLSSAEPQLAGGIRAAIEQGIWAAAGEARYRFRHVLLRDAAYQLQTQARLRELHGLAAAAIEQVYGERSAAHVAELAHHAQLAGDVRRERRYLDLLGEQAFNIGAFPQAISCFERALVRAHDAEEATHGPLLARLARAHVRLGQTEQARARYAESLAIAEAAGDQPLVAGVCYELGGLAQRRADHQAARELLERALAGYRAVDDAPALGRTLNMLGALYIALDDADRAMECYEEALRLGRRARG
jgi:class 3 adenylate cyclase/tetratricopeptide (TPR) repeat protein